MDDENLKAAIAEIRATIRKYDLFATVVIQSQAEVDGFIISDPTWGGTAVIGGNEPGLARMEFKTDYPTDSDRVRAQNETLSCLMTATEVMVELLRTMKDMGDVISTEIRTQIE